VSHYACTRSQFRRSDGHGRAVRPDSRLVGRRNRQLQADIAAADAGSTGDQVTYMKKAAQELSQDAAADFPFLLPNLTVADKNITGLPTNASPRASTCPHSDGPGPSDHPQRPPQRRARTRAP